jgi:hypothetical protein
MTRDEFEQGYAERSGVTVEWLHEHGWFGAPCDCREVGCEGWQMTHARPGDLGAREHGCDCPRIDNRGKRPGEYVTRADCPVHGDKRGEV